jgi:hypothetical protein
MVVIREKAKWKRKEKAEWSALKESMGKSVIQHT